jgi:hypothetical protein
VDARIEPRQQEKIQRFGKGGSPDFGDAEGEQFQEGGPAGQGLVDRVHDFELPAAGEDKLPRDFAFIDDTLDVGNELRTALDFVNNDALRVGGEEAARIGGSEFADVRAFQVGIGHVREDLAAQGGLAALPGTGQGDHGVFRDQVLEHWFNGSINHVECLSDDCTFCN